MKQVLAFFIVLLALAACSDKQQAEKSGTPFEQYVDSITKVYPNFKGNIAVQEKICEDFGRHLNALPGILEGAQFDIVNMGEVAGKTMVMFTCKTGDVTLWCEDFGTEKAAQLDKSKSYKVTGGTLERYVPTHGIAGDLLKLGEVYVKDLTVEEI
jgi:uncharacterized lipoprotein